MKITGYTALTSKPAQIKEWVSTKGPVSACFVVYQDFFSYKSGIYRHVTGNQAGGHCVTIIGYNDSPGYWICRIAGTRTGARMDSSALPMRNAGLTAGSTTVSKALRTLVGRRTGASAACGQSIKTATPLSTLRVSAGDSPDNDNIFLDMLSQLIAAKTAARPVNYYEENGVIKQVYVF